jgi:hypothetical protein
MNWEKELLGQFVNPAAAVLIIGCGDPVVCLVTD